MVPVAIPPPADPVLNCTTLAVKSMVPRLSTAPPGPLETLSSKLADGLAEDNALLREQVACLAGADNADGRSGDLVWSSRSRSEGE